MYALFKETSHANFISHKSNYGVNPAANPKNWVAFDGQHVHYSTNNLDVLTQELVWYFRKTAGELNESIFNDRATITAIKGNSVAWNQLIDNAWNGNHDNLYSYDSSTNTWTFGTYAGSKSYIEVYQLNNNIINGHKYYCSVYITILDNCTVRFSQQDNYSFILPSNNSTSTTGYYSSVKIATANTNFRFVASRRNSSATWKISFRHLVFIDLTNIYGAGNEPSTAAAFEADYFKWFGHSIGYEPYDPGSIRNTKIDSLKTIGLNQWDEQWENGYWADNGNLVSAQNQICTSSYTPVIFGSTYHYNVRDGGVCFYDVHKQFLYRIGSTAVSTGSTFIVPSCASFIRLLFGAPYGATYKNNICVCLNDSNINDQYQPYEDRTYSIPITSITGKLNGSGNSVVVFPDGMKSAGSVADEIVVEGGVTKAIKRVGYITRSNFVLHNTSNANYTTLRTSLSSAKHCNVDQFNFTNSFNIQYSGSLSSATVNYETIQWNGTTDTTFYVSIAPERQLNGFAMTYELETYQIYVLDNFNLPLNVKVWKSGTERYESNDSTGTSPKLTIHYNAQ